jgi:hypothetical protein
MDKKTITKQQAIARVEQIIRDTVSIMKPTPRLERYPALAEETSCVDPADRGSTERSVITRTYWLRGVPRSENRSIGVQARSYWESQNVKLTHTVGLDSGQLKVIGYTRPDDFLVSLSTNTQEALAFTVTSPCFWPNGTPEPSGDDG